MNGLLRFDITELKAALSNLNDEKNYRRIVYIFDNISQYLDMETLFFDKHKELTLIFVKEAFPRIFNFIISTKNYQQLFFWISIYIRMCNFMALCRLFIFIPYFPTLFELIQSIESNENYIYSFGYQAQSLIKFINKECDLNIYSKLLIDQLVQVQLVNVEIIPMLINDIPFRTSFSELSDSFKIFNYVFPCVNKSLLKQYESEFSKFKYSINDPRFDNPISINLAKAMTTCSPKFAPLHFDNLLKFIKMGKNEAKKEFVNLLKKSDNLKVLKEKIVKNFDIIISQMRADEEYLNEICYIILSNKIVTPLFFFEKAGSDLLYNLILFDFGKDLYTKEKVTKVIESEPFCSKTVEFGFKVIDYKIDLMPDVSTFLRKSLFSPYFKEDMIETIISLSKRESNRQILLKSITDFDIQNQQEYQNILQILISLKPTANEFNYDDFTNEILNYTDSLFILPFLKKNRFIPIQSIDVEFLVSYSIFNQELRDFLFDNFSDTLINYTDFFLTFSIDDYDDIEFNQIFGRFLFDLFERSNSNDTRLLWESIIRLEDKDEEIHQIAQKIINENLTKSQMEIIEKVGGGYSKYFINFDFSNFNEISSEENGNFLIFNKPSLISEESFFYYPSKIRYALNHSESINEDDLLQLFEIRTNDSAIDAIILNTIFDASMKMNITFPFVEESLILSLELKYSTFVDKLINYIINSEGEIIDFNGDLLNSISNFNEKLLIDLIQNKKVPHEILFNFFSHFNNPHSLSVLSKIDFQISKNLLYNLVYSKKDFIDFCESKRIDSNEIIPFIFSYNFPQFFRTKNFMNSIFKVIKSNSILLLNFLKSQKWNELVKEPNKFSSQKNFIPYVKLTKYFHLYFAFARIIPLFKGFNKSKISNFLANIIYSREGEEDSSLSPPINEMKNNLQNFISEKEQPNEYLIEKFVDKIMSKLPDFILKQFELFYFIRTASNYVINHDFSLKIISNSISKELENFCFIQNPQILLFRIHKKKEFEIERTIDINGKTYFLSSIVTHSNLYVPCKAHKKSENNGYVRWSNGEKVKVKSIEGEPLFIFYQICQDDYFYLKKKFDKIRSANYVFNTRAVLCESLYKANVDWTEWTADQILFEIATILLCQVGYSGLFKALCKNSQFSEFFFTSNWEEKFPINDINDELISLAHLYPRKDELLSVLFKSVREKNRQHFASIILSSFELNDEFVGKLIDIISPSFKSFEDVLINYFSKQTTTNDFLLKNEQLTEFVLKGIEKRYPQNSFIQFQHLLNPMTDNLFVTCLKCLNKKSVDSLLSSFSGSTSRILLAMTELQHTEELASIFCQIQPILKSVIDNYNDNKQSNIDEFRKDLKWIEFCLSSSNKRIRNHTYSIFRIIFNKSDSELLRSTFESTIVKSLFLPQFEEVKDFIETLSGVPFPKRPEFTVSIYDQLFKRTYLHKNQGKIMQYIIKLPPVPKKMIPIWKSIVDQSEGDFFATMGNELILISIRCCFEPTPNYFQNIMSEIACRHDYIAMENILKYFSLFINDDNVHSYFRMIIEFEKWIPYYIHLINNIMINVKEFRETQLIIMAIVLPNQVISQRAAMKVGFNGFNSNGEIFISSLEIAIKALEMIVDKKAFIRIVKDQESNELTSRLYSLLIVKYFQVGLNLVFEIFLGKNLYNVDSIQQWRIQVTKLYLKYMSLCSISFPVCAQLSMYFIERNSGLTLFGSAFQEIHVEWSDFCVEVSRSILADIQFNKIENKKMAVRTVNRELCTDLFHYSFADKSFMRFLIGVMKNDKLRIETKLKCNFQIFNVFRNDFVMYIDDVALFIENSLDIYPEFFNDIEIKKFVFKLKINDHQIIQKLKIISALFEKRGDKMKELIEEIFPVFEQLTNTEMELDDDLSNLLNSVFEQALVIYTS